MKFLFDQNLSPRLPRLLADIYPESLHVREIGMREATDTEIWQYAKTNNFVVVSKDSDFQSRSLFYESPPNSFGFALGIARSRQSKICYETIPSPFILLLKTRHKAI